MWLVSFKTYIYIYIYKYTWPGVENVRAPWESMFNLSRGPNSHILKSNSSSPTYFICLFCSLIPARLTCRGWASGGLARIWQTCPHPLQKRQLPTHTNPHRSGFHRNVGVPVKCSAWKSGCQSMNPDFYHISLPLTPIPIWGVYSI